MPNGCTSRTCSARPACISRRGSDESLPGSTFPVCLRHQPSLMSATREAASRGHPEGVLRGGGACRNGGRRSIHIDQIAESPDVAPWRVRTDTPSGGVRNSLVEGGLRLDLLTRSSSSTSILTPCNRGSTSARETNGDRSRRSTLSSSVCAGPRRTSPGTGVLMRRHRSQPSSTRSFVSGADRRRRMISERPVPRCHRHVRSPIRGRCGCVRRRPRHVRGSC